ncbi:tolloid-like protein 1 isoform X2 [Styela clava]
MENIYKLIKLVAIVNLMLLEFTESTSAGNKASGCGNIVIKAEARTKYATTPGFPNAFPGDANCVWAIHSKPGKRIELDFQKFHLLQPVDGNCEYHYVIVKSPFTLFSMGPYCGEYRLPVIVSAENLIHVELHTIVPVTTDNYQGFKLAFRETLETSSYQLRPDMDLISPTAAPPTRPRTVKSTAKPWRFVPSRRPLLNTKNRPVLAARSRPPPRSPHTRRPARPSFVNTNNKFVARSTPTSGCGNIVTKAEARTKYATTPGFPNAFPGDANCVWAIYSKPGKRIRLEFQKFYLLPPFDGNCEYHYVIVKSPFSLFSMGPYCGELGLPTIVSTGNLIYVELHTIFPVNTDNYQGFKLAFRETLESSSYELRPDNSDGDVIMTVDPDTLDVISPTAAPTTTPSRSSAVTFYKKTSKTKFREYK